MNISEMAERLVGIMQRTKEDWIGVGPEQPDLLTHIHVIRGDDVVAVIMAQPDRDAMLNLCNKAAYAFSATAISATFETLHTYLDENPITHNQWEQGDMQWVAETEGAREKGWVTDALTTFGHDRDGNEFFSTIPYSIEGSKVIWGEEKRWSSDNEEDQEFLKIGGYVTDTMKAIMRGGTITEKIEEELTNQPVLKFLTETFANSDPSGETREFHQDMAALQYIATNPSGTGTIAICLQAKPNTLRAQLIEERAESGSGIPRAEVFRPERPADQSE